ncbi:MAG: FMN-binding negative transcriptional regulator [Ferruginibacter sp.]
MYKLPYFTEPDKSKVIAFIKANYFAVITGKGEEYPVATHIPLEIIEEDDRIKLIGHLMKNTDHHLAFLKDENVLVVFNGPHTHVSASWYEIKNVGSTWNYMTVHAKGKIRFKDEAATVEAVKRITDRYEGPDSPASFSKLPEAYISKLVKAISAFEITVESFDNVFKLSQNMSKTDQQSIISNLQKREDPGAHSIARIMKERL